MKSMLCCICLQIMIMTFKANASTSSHESYFVKLKGKRMQFNSTGIVHHSRSEIKCSLKCSGDCTHINYHRDLGYCETGQSTTTLIDDKDWTVFKKEYRDCRSEWHLALHVNEHGTVEEGSRDDLLRAVYGGARIRVVFENWQKYDVFNQEGTSVSVHYGHLVCAQFKDHLLNVNHTSFGDPLQERYSLVCSDGRIVQALGSSYGSYSSTTLTVKWFVKFSYNSKENIVSYEHDANGYSNDQTGLEKLKAAVGGQRAAKLTAVLSNGVVIAMDAFGKDELLTPFAIQHDKRFTVIEENGSSVRIQLPFVWQHHVVMPSGYCLKYSYENDGYDKATDRYGMSWYADECWALRLSVDSDGSVVAGNFSSVYEAVVQGKRILAKVNERFIEPDYLKVTETNVLTAQHVSVETTMKTLDSTKKDWQAHDISSNGECGKSLSSTLIHGSFPKLEKETCSTMWFEHLSPWKRVFTHDASGKVTGGIADRLVVAISKGAMVRVVIDRGTSLLALNLHNVGVTVRDGLKVVTGYSVQKNNVRVFVSTQGTFEMKEIYWGAPTSSKPSYHYPSKMQWFVNY